MFFFSRREHTRKTLATTTNDDKKTALTWLFDKSVSKRGEKIKKSVCIKYHFLTHAFDETKHSRRLLARLSIVFHSEEMLATFFSTLNEFFTRFDLITHFSPISLLALMYLSNVYIYSLGSIWLASKLHNRQYCIACSSTIPSCSFDTVWDWRSSLQLLMIQNCQLFFWISMINFTMYSLLTSQTILIIFFLL